MKIKHLAVLTALSTFTIIGCDNNKEDETTVTTTENQAENASMASENTTATTGTATITDADVPAEVKTTFTAKYPKAQSTTWTRYQPVADDGLDMNETYYYVRFNNDGSDYINWYNMKGEWVKTSTLVSNESDLPSPVNKYIKDNYSGYTVEEINKENDKDRDVYEIKLNKGDEKLKIKVTPQGEIVKMK